MKTFSIKLNVRLLSTAAAALLLFPVATAARAQKFTVQEPQSAATTWLHLVDAGKYGASYDATAAFFKAHVTKQQWQSASTSVHAKVGSLRSRKLLKDSRARILPGMPSGTYVVLQYGSVFSNLPHAIEIAVLERDSDKKWRINGYFVKKAP